jgi:DNA-binding MarR family transcriptional regulator
MSKDHRQDLVREVQSTLRSLHEAVDYLSQTLADQLGINRTDFRCLQILGLHGPRTAGQLAEESGLTTGAVTTVLDRLERANLASRARDTEDRRRVLVEMTPEAQARVSTLYAGLVSDSTAMLSAYSDDELLLVRDFLARGAAITREHAERVKQQHAEPALQECTGDGELFT